MTQGEGQPILVIHEGEGPTSPRRREGKVRPDEDAVQAIRRTYEEQTYLPWRVVDAFEPPPRILIDPPGVGRLQLTLARMTPGISDGGPDEVRLYVVINPPIDPGRIGIARPASR